MRKRVFQVAFICWCQNGGCHECTYCMFALILCVSVCIWRKSMCIRIRTGPYGRRCSTSCQRGSRLRWWRSPSRAHAVTTTLARSPLWTWPARWRRTRSTPSSIRVWAGWEEETDSSLRYNNTHDRSGFLLSALNVSKPCSATENSFRSTASTHKDTLNIFCLLSVLSFLEGDASRQVVMLPPGLKHSRPIEVDR